MPEADNNPKEQLDVLGPFPPDETTEEKVDALWRQVMVYKSFADSDLSEAKARRAEAEAAREQAELEGVSATRALCDRLRAEAQRDSDEAARVKAEAMESRREADAELVGARKTKARAESEAERVVASAKEKAQEILDDARESASSETTDLRRQALNEIRAVFTRVENMGAAAKEELETQRILTNVARLKSGPGHVSTNEMREEAETRASVTNGADSGPMSNGGPADPNLSGAPEIPRHKLKSKKSSTNS